MEDSRPETGPAPPKVGAETFAYFLKRIHADSETAGREYARLRDKLAGFFAMRGDSDPEAAADEALDRVAAKMAGGAQVPDIRRYSLGVARLVALERQRRTKREQQAFVEFNGERENRFDELTEQTYRLMRDCLERLTEREKQLLTDYCCDARGRERARWRETLAGQWGLTTLALRLRVHHLRARLADCVKKSAKK